MALHGDGHLAGYGSDDYEQSLALLPHARKHLAAYGKRSEVVGLHLRAYKVQRHLFRRSGYSHACGKKSNVHALHGVHDSRYGRLVRDVHALICYAAASGDLLGLFLAVSGDCHYAAALGRESLGHCFAYPARSSRYQHVFSVYVIHGITCLFLCGCPLSRTTRFLHPEYERTASCSQSPGLHIVFSYIICKTAFFSSL